MRYVAALLVFIAVAAPVVLFALAPTAAPAAPSVSSSAAPAAGSLTTASIVVSAGHGLRLSSTPQKAWTSPRGLPAGSFAALVADPTTTGSAYVANGDVYHTTDGGAHWARLAPPPRSLVGMGGVTALAVDPTDGTLYAAGHTIVSYRGASGWQAWGAGPRNLPPALLAVGRQHDLYAAVGDALYYSLPSSSSWVPVQRADGGVWPAAPITALGRGLQRNAIIAAIRGSGLWSVTGNTGYALGVVGTGTDDIVSLALESTLGQRLLAVTANGGVYDGQPTSDAQVQWAAALSPVNPADVPLVAAINGAEWPTLKVPPQFAQNCIANGRAPTTALPICGPFVSFYQRLGTTFLFGYPRGPARALGGGVVVQDFDRAQFRWTPSGGTTLAPVNWRPGLLGFTAMKPPSPQVGVGANTAYYPRGYYVDPMFYEFWRGYLLSNGVSIFGPPESQATRGTSSDASGQPVRVQYFRNVRLEYRAGAIGPSIRLSYLPDDALRQ